MFWRNIVISVETLNKEKSSFTFICKGLDHLPGPGSRVLGAKHFPRAKITCFGPDTGLTENSCY